MKFEERRPQPESDFCIQFQCQTETFSKQLDKGFLADFEVGQGSGKACVQAIGVRGQRAAVRVQFGAFNQRKVLGRSFKVQQQMQLTVLRHQVATCGRGKGRGWAGCRPSKP